MGQSNSPFLSKFGVSLHWFAMHTTKINYTRKLNEDIFLNMFLPLFFKKTFLNQSKLNGVLKEFFTKKIKIKITFSFIFFSKLWLLRYQNKLIVLFYTYNAKFEKLAKKNFNELVCSNFKATQKLTSSFKSKNNYFLF